MHIISFSYCVAPLLCGAKTATWRNWDGDYAKRFTKGQTCAAYDRCPRAFGKKVAEIRLTANPEYMSSADVPDKFWIEEGMKWLYEHPGYLPKTLWGRPCNLEHFSFAAFRRWQASNHLGFIVRFELTRVMPGVRTVY